MRHALRCFALLGSLYLAALPSAAAESAPSTATDTPVVVLEAAHWLDVVDGTLHSPGRIRVEGDRITAVGDAVTIDGATIVDLGERTLLPGLMDMHVHLGSNLEPGYQFQMVTENSAERALRTARNARTTLMAGFTTVRSLGQVHPTRELLDVAVSHAADAGWLDAPRIVSAGHALSITGGHIDPDMFGPFAEGIFDFGPHSGVVDGPLEVIKAVRYQIKHGARVIKISATAGVMSQEAALGAQQMTDAEIRAAVEEAARHDIRVAAHAHGSAGILAAVRAGVASIEHGSLLTDEIITEMKTRGTFLVPTTGLTDVLPLDQLPPVVRAKAESILPRARASTSRAIEAGVKIAVGTDAPLIPHGRNALEIEALVERGMTTIGAIRAATVHAAELLGVDDRGRIEAGLLADLIAVTGNPLDDVGVLGHVDFVMLGGRLVKTPGD